MNREVYVRICEGVGVKFPRATRLVSYAMKSEIEYILNYYGLILIHTCW